LTLRLVRRTHSIIDSHGFVEASVCFNEPLMPRRVSVSVLPLELGGENVQPVERLVVIVECPCVAQPALDGGPVALG